MHKRLLNKAVALAKDNWGIRNQFKLAAVMCYKNKVIAVGVNSKKTHPMQARFQAKRGSVCLHAEIDCLKNALKVVAPDDLAKCKMVVARVKKGEHGEMVPALAKPCRGCDRALVQFEVGEVWFSTEDGFERAM